jgi:N-formylglutamate amidohydrolase
MMWQNGQAPWPGVAPFVVHEPSRLRVPLVFSSPHSGRYYPPDLLKASKLDASRLRKSEDAFVEELFAGVTAVGAPLIAARYPRAYIDLNREPFELDPELIEEELPAFANSRSLRVLGGLGTIARVVGDSEEIYKSRMSLAEAFARIDHFYWPYHRALRGLLDRAVSAFGVAVLIDCHSMPSVGAMTGANTGPPPSRAHFVLGDRFGTSCFSDLTDFVRSVLNKRGYEVALNRPYAGGYITEHYGAPGLGVHALQLEINRSLFTNEVNLTISAGFEATKHRLLQLASDLAQYSLTLPPLRAAAE